MEQKTTITAEEGKQEIWIARVFDLPVELLFEAYIKPNLVEQWMGTKVLKLETHPHGSYTFVTTDPMGNKHGFNGVIHEIILNSKITRTFEMENTNYPVQLEYLEFERINDTTSKLIMQVVYKSIAHRDAILKLPFAYGINMAHNKLQALNFKQK